ncbi:MAG: helix-turn-helix transcriptional regulator [Eggerthellaceae bacterium]|nr:helix-turn-helix transcriptional regulator [Eggerthellaceae bacterium]
MHSDDFMNAEDVARYLHLGKNTVYQLAKSGKLASYHVGRKLKFTLEDVEAYVASTHHANALQNEPRVQTVPSTGEEALSVQSLSQAAAFGQLEGDPLVVAGTDIVTGFIVSALNASGMPATHLVRASYTALVNLYAGDADAAIVNLYDQRSNAYNIPYAQRLAPGVSIVIMRLCGRKQGFIVQKGNPKGITSWGGLLREGVRLSNREKGSGARVLLDEKLRAMEARSESIDGYDSHANVASTAIRRVAAGLADVAIGTRREAQRIEGVSFVPLQTEWIDLVIKKTPKSRPYIRQISELLSDHKFQRDTMTLGPCDVSHMGSIIYES